MSLRGIDYQEDYRSGHDNMLEDFFRPSLREARIYWRAVGYFSSSALESFGTPLGEFLKNDGHIRLVTSVELSEADILAIAKGAEKRVVCTERIEQIIDEDFSGTAGPGLLRLTRLLEIGRLEIRIAIPSSGVGIYHEKVGVFFDDHDDFVAFTGSSNESRNAFENNRECIDVYPSWNATIRANRKRHHFEELWNGEDKGVIVYTFPEAAKHKLLKVAQRHSPSQDWTATRWRHQEEAVRIFLDAERGILNMATGTGKTRTALKIIRALFDSGDIDCVIVSMDGNDLLRQWYGQLLSLRNDLSRQIKVYRDYDQHKEALDFNLSPNEAILLVSRQPGAKRDPLASALRNIESAVPRRTLLVYDEVHRLGSAGNRSRLAGLTDHIRYRLGLSATPEREYDVAGNQFVESHVGPELVTFTLDDAIRRGILAPFNYFPLSYELTDNDRARIRDVYRKQAARAAAGEPMSEEEIWIELARVYKTSPAKLPVFDQFINAHRELLQRCIIFVETQEYGNDVLDIVHKYRSDFHTYFAGDQTSILQRFARNELECLITCHRLSEGIDIKSLNAVILFSSARARLETIQRIGRCLRTDPANPDKIANIVDFTRSSGDGGDPSADEERATWLAELSRVRPEE